MAFRGDGDEKDEKIEMVEKFRRRGSKSVSFSESEEPKRRTRLNPILPRQKKSLEEDPVTCDCKYFPLFLPELLLSYISKQSFLGAFFLKLLF